MENKAMIDKNGNIHIMRAGKWKPQRCPDTIDSKDSVYCGGWCPRFHEWIDSNGVKHLELGCCHIHIPITVDMREQGGDS